MDEAKEQILYGMQHCNVLKISDNEIQWLTGMEDYDAGILLLMEKYHIPLILLSILHYILEHGWREYNEKELGEMLEFANAAASIVTTRKGALRVMPKLEEISHVQRGV